MLNEDEKNLLAVCRFFNTEKDKKRVARLVKKLATGFDMETIVHMTGFTLVEIDDLISSVPSKHPAKKAQTNAINEIGPSKKTVKVLAKVAETDTERPKNSQRIADEKAKAESDANKSERLAIHLNAESEVSQRIAHEMSKYIERELNPGDKWPSSVTLMRLFGGGGNNTSDANKILVNHNWIERVNPENVRKGYRVK